MNNYIYIYIIYNMSWIQHVVYIFFTHLAKFLVKPQPHAAKSAPPVAVEKRSMKDRGSLLRAAMGPGAGVQQMLRAMR